MASDELLAAIDRACERVAAWPEWKKRIGDAWIAQVKEDMRIIREDMDYVRIHGEQ